MNTKKMTQLAMLTGIALIIFVIEIQIPNPFPVPGIKLGLANIITVYAVYCYRPSEVMMIVFCQIFLAAVFSSNMMALAYSFAGSVLCLTGMLPLRKLIDLFTVFAGVRLSRQCFYRRMRADGDKENESRCTGLLRQNRFLFLVISRHDGRQK